MSVLATNDGDEGRQARSSREGSATIVPLRAHPAPPLDGGHLDWGHVVEAHEPGLRRLIARKMADRELVDDALQETYLRLVRDARVGGRGAPDGRWLRTLARRASTDLYRTQPPPAVDLDTLAVAGDALLPGSDEHLDGVDRRQAMRWALGRLSPRHRRLLALRGLHELSYREIAAVENLSEEAVTAALNRARSRLRAQLHAYEHRRAVPALGLWLGYLSRRLRWRLQELGPRAAELAGATFAVGVVAVMTMPAPSPEPGNPVVLAGASRAAAEIVQAAAAAADAVDPRPATDRAATRAGRDGSASTPSAPDAERPLVAGRSEVKVGREETVLRYSLELHDPTGGSSTHVGVEVYCERGRVAATTCPVLDALPQPQRGSHTFTRTPLG